MPKIPERRAQDMPPMPSQLKTTPLTRRPIKRGRPKKTEKPAIPQMDLRPFEAEWVDYVMYVYNEEYDLSESDQILLHLYAIEYVKYLRTINWELSNDMQITMARQHPGTRLDALLDRLGITRRHRLLKGDKSDGSRDAIRESLLQLGLEDE